jgi:hypothetical protein
LSISFVIANALKERDPAFPWSRAAVHEAGGVLGRGLDRLQVLRRKVFARCLDAGLDPTWVLTAKLTAIPSDVGNR